MLKLTELLCFILSHPTGGDYLVEILGRYLNVYGMGAIKFVDKLWNAQKAHDVHTVKFSYINFNSISPVLGRIKGLLLLND